jgi:PPP family 3-phenylpropionic acid transporter
MEPSQTRAPAIRTKNEMEEEESSSALTAPDEEETAALKRGPGRDARFAAAAADDEETAALTRGSPAQAGSGERGAGQDARFAAAALDDEEETVALTRGSPAPAGGKRGSPVLDPLDAHFAAHAAADPYLILHRSVYFLGMGANAAYFPFAVQFWMSPPERGGLGLTASEAGTVFAVGHLVVLFLAPLVSNYADGSEARRRLVLVGGLTGQACAVLLMSQARTFAGVVACEALQEALSCAVWPSVDAATQRLLEVRDGDAAGYGAVRAWGAVGWGGLAVLYGALYDRLGLPAMFLTFALSMLPAAALLTRLPLEKRAATAAGSASALRALLRVDVLVVFLVCLICAVLLQVVDVFRFPFLASLGASNALLGSSLTITAVSEAPFFFVTSAILKRISLRTALILVTAGYALRFVYYSLLIDPVLTLPAELMHGVTFALGWAAATQYVTSLLPPELSSTAQGLLSAVQWGLGSALGSFCFGAVAAAWGWRAMWLVGAVLGVVGAALMATQKSPGARPAPAEAPLPAPVAV